MSLPEGGHARLDNAWLTAFIRDLPTADAICLYLQSRGNLRRKGADLGELISALGPRDLRTVERTVKSLLAHGRVVKDGASYYAPAFAPAQPPASSPGQTPAAAPGDLPGNSSNTQEGDMRQDGKNGDKPAPEEEKEENKRKQDLESESEQVGRGESPPHSRAGEGAEEVTREEGGACGAEAPDSARRGPARPVTVPFQPPASAGTAQATSTEKVPGAAAGGGGPGSPPNPTRAALLVAFGPVFLAQLLSESDKRQGWLSLPAARVAELHQQALESCTGGTRPWRTLFISQLDIEVTPKPANLRLDKPQEEWTREEWLS